MTEEDGAWRGAGRPVSYLKLPVARYAGPVVQAAPGARDEPVKWLTDEELASWLAVVRLMTWLPWSIDQQLQRDSNLAMVEYQVLAMLSNSPQWTMRMSSLAEVTNASLSRLSHVVKRLEARPWSTGNPIPPTDGSPTPSSRTTGIRRLSTPPPTTWPTCGPSSSTCCRGTAPATRSCGRPHHGPHRHIHHQLAGSLERPPTLKEGRLVAYQPIESYGVIGDMRTAVLVG